MISIDRIENGIAAAYDSGGAKTDIPLSMIVGSPREGDVLVYSDGKYLIDRAAAEERRRKIKAIMTRRLL